MLSDVQQFGAVPGTGKTAAQRAANRTAVQNAIDAVIAAGGGCVLIPDVFEIDGALTADISGVGSPYDSASVTIQGYGYRASRLIQTAATPCTTLTLVGGNSGRDGHFIVRGLGIERTAAAASGYIGIVVSNASGTIIEKTWSRHMHQAIVLYKSYGCRVLYNFSFETAQHINCNDGFQTANALIYEGNKVFRSGNYALAGSNMAACLFAGGWVVNFCRNDIEACYEAAAFDSIGSLNVLGTGSRAANMRP
jgi:hypothetical protein